jgi:hypothetical protein
MTFFHRFNSPAVFLMMIVSFEQVFGFFAEGFFSDEIVARIL